MNRYRGPPTARASQATSSTLCQKCLKRDMYLPFSLCHYGVANAPKRHYSFECKAAGQERPYVSRPSRSQQLRNPKLVPKLNNEVPNELLRKTGVADEILENRGRKRSREPTNREPTRKRSRSDSASSGYSSSSVSTISTNRDRSHSRSRSRSRSPPRRTRHDSDSEDDHMITSQQLLPEDTAVPSFSHDRKRRRRHSSSSVESVRPRNVSHSRDRNTRRRRSSISPEERGRRRSRSRRSYSRDSSRKSGRRNQEHSRTKSPPKHGREQEGSRNRNVGRGFSGAANGRAPRQQPPPDRRERRERSLSPYSKRLALTQAMNTSR